MSCDEDRECEPENAPPVDCDSSNNDKDGGRIQSSELYNDVLIPDAEAAAKYPFLSLSVQLEKDFLQTEEGWRAFCYNRRLPWPSRETRRDDGEDHSKLTTSQERALDEQRNKQASGQCRHKATK